MRAVSAVILLVGLQGMLRAAEPPTLQGCREILEGKHDERPESDFYMIGAIQ